MIRKPRGGIGEGNKKSAGKKKCTEEKEGQRKGSGIPSKEKRIAISKASIMHNPFEYHVLTKTVV